MKEKLRKALHIPSTVITTLLLVVILLFVVYDAKLSYERSQLDKTQAAKEKVYEDFIESQMELKENERKLASAEAEKQKLEREKKSLQKSLSNIAYKKRVAPKLASPRVRRTYSGSCYTYVPAASAKYNVDADLMNRIIAAESGGNPNAKNAHSSASGCAQFIKGTWNGSWNIYRGSSVFDPYANVNALALKISLGGLSAWNASRHNWSR